DKVDSERTGNGMKKYWQNIIEKREQYKRKRNSDNDNDKEKEQPLSKRSKSKLSYSQWNFKTVCNFYKIDEEQDPSISAFPVLKCECANLNDKNPEKLYTNLAIPIGNEASRSLYVSSYLVAVSNLLQNRFIICPEKIISGPNRHGPLDYALVTSTSSKVIGAVEVKATDYLRLAFNFLNVR
ncbi:29791_t:CDS:2, partial [Gigaspora margarita]